MVKKDTKVNLLIGLAFISFVILILGIGISTDWFGLGTTVKVGTPLITGGEVFTQPKVTTAETQAPSNLQGQSFSANIIAYDRANTDPNTRITGIATYVWDQNSKKFIADATTLATDTTTSVTVGQQLCYVGFNTTLYGKVKCKPAGWDPDSEMWRRGDTLELDLYRVSTGLSMIFKGNTSTSDTVSAQELGASQTEAFNRLEIQLNESSRAYNFAGIYWDYDVNTNLTGGKISHGSGVNYNPGSASYNTVRNVQTSMPAGVSFRAWGTDIIRTNNDDIRYALLDANGNPAPVLLLQWDRLNLNTITFEADSGGTTGEVVDARAFDYAPFRSINGEIKEGVEDDTPTHADTGGIDIMARVTLS